MDAACAGVAAGLLYVMEISIFELCVTRKRGGTEARGRSNKGYPVAKCVCLPLLENKLNEIYYELRRISLSLQGYIYPALPRGFLKVVVYFYNLHKTQDTPLFGGKPGLSAKLAGLLKYFFFFSPPCVCVLVISN